MALIAVMAVVSTPWSVCHLISAFPVCIDRRWITLNASPQLMEQIDDRKRKPNEGKRGHKCANSVSIT